MPAHGDAAQIIGTLKKGQRYPIRITYLNGGSAAFWMEQVDLRGYGDLDWVVNELGRFRRLLAGDGSWVKRPDVILNEAQRRLPRQRQKRPARRGGLRPDLTL